MLVSAGPAFADSSITSAGPLTQIGTSSDLNCSVNHVGDTAGEWFGDTACGTFVAVGGTLYGPADIPAGGAASPRTGWTAVSQNTSGTGTAASPATITTVVNGGSVVQVTQVDSYVFGQESYLTSVTVKNTSGSPETLVLYRAGDCFLANSDFGFGRTDTVGAGKAPTCIESNGAGTGPGTRIEQLLPLTAGSNFVEDGYSTVWADVGSQQPLPNTCTPCATAVDNGIGLSWSMTLAAGASQTFSHLSTFSPTGQVPIVASKAADASGATSGAQDGYTVTFHNGGAGAATLDSVTDTLPAGFTYVAGSTTGAITANPTGSTGQVVWTGPFTVAAGGDLTFHFNVTVATTAGHYTNDITAASAASSVVPATATAPIDVSTTGRGAIVASKTADATPVTPGANDGYTVVFHNPNATAATLTSVTDTLPTGFTYVAGSTTGGVTADPTGTTGQLVWTGPFTVPASGDLTFHFAVTASVTPGHFTNSVTAASAAETITAATNTAPVDVASIVVIPALPIEGIPIALALVTGIGLAVWWRRRARRLVSTERSRRLGG